MHKNLGLMNRTASGKGSPVLIVLLVVLVVAGVGFFVVKNKGKSADDWRFEAETQTMLQKTLQEAKDYFGDQNPQQLPADPNAPDGSVPTANHYLFKVEASGETLYFYINHRFAGGQDTINAHKLSDADGPWQ